MNLRSNHAFTLAEFIVGVVFVGVVLGPFLVFVARIHDLNSVIGQQGRREAWRSFNDRAVTSGIDPTLAPALGHALNAAVPVAPSPVVETGSITAVAGLPSIVPLRIAADARLAEPRIPAGGYQIGAGAAVTTRSVPAAPLLPVVMPLPVVTPADGTVVLPSSLTPQAAGAPYVLMGQAASSANATVRSILNRPFGQFSGAGIAQFSVTAVDLLQGVNGIAWSEFPGNPAVGDRPVVLEDGRTRWLVTTSENRQQIYEPSPKVVFAYKIGLGAPILSRAGVEHTTGTTHTFDYADYLRVQDGTTTLRLDFPAAVKAVFGDAWSAQAIGYSWTFGQTAGSFAGELRPFFAADVLSLWADNVIVAASPVVPSGGSAESGTWTLSRTKSELGVPLLATPGDAAGMFAAGTVQFNAPPGPGGVAIGRLSFNGGTSLSTGSTLSLPVTP